MTIITKTLLVSCLLFALASCSSDKDIKSDLVNVTNVKSFEDEYFVNTKTLHSDIFNDSIISKPLGLALCDTLLFVMEPSYSSDTLVRCYSTLDKSYLGAVCLKGEGPSELLSAANISVSTDSTSYWIFDITKQVWMKRPCSDTSIPSSNNINKINLRDSQILGINNPTWLDNKSFIFNSLFKYKERFFICDSETMVKRPVYNPSFEFKEDFDVSILAEIFSTHLCTNESHNRIVLAGRYLDLIEIYNTEGKLINMIKGPEKGFNFKFDEQRSISRNVLVKSTKSKRAYLDVKAVSNKIYTLYSGKTKEDKEHYSYSKTLYVFSMDGDCIVKYVLDKPICNFTIDVHKNRIYGISENAEIIYFQL